MKTKTITYLYSIAFIINICLVVGVYVVLSPLVPGYILEVLLGLSVCVVIFNQAVIYRPIACSVKRRSQVLQGGKLAAEKIAAIPINNPSPLMQITFDGEVIFMNPAAQKHYPKLEKEGFSSPVLAGLEDFMAQGLRAPNGKNILTRECKYKNVSYHQTISVSVIDDQPALIIYCYDITAIKTAQNEARMLGTVIDSAKDGIIITKPDIENPEILYANEGVSTISGYSAEELIGQTPRILQGPSTNKKVLAELKEKLRNGQAFEGELQNYSKNGRVYWLDISIVPVKDETGEVTHFAAIERDITQRKIFEKQLQITKDAAEVANRAKGDFLANISHELRTPMNGIIGLSELLTDMNLTEEQNELASAVLSSSQNLLILLNDILDLSKIEAGELTLENIPYNTRRMVGQTVDLLRPIASRKSVVLESTINPIVPDRLMGDPARVQQIMNNLISNAIKFTEVGYVRVDVTSKRDSAGDHALHIRVEDTGIGISDDKREAVFQKFTQADVSTARKYGGTGLGLAITKELVEMMGGNISFDSAEERGTTFYVELPVSIAKKSNISEEKSKEALPINLQAKLMIVDDHPVNLLFIRKVLKKLGFKNVDEARSGKEAIELAEQHAYDLIFMDCQMPEIDGFEASTIIREREELIGDIKIIAVTADAMKGAREKCLDSGMNDYISKPVDIEKLKAILGTWIPGDVPQDDNKNCAADDAHPALSDSGAQDGDADGTQDISSDIMDWERLRLFTDDDPEEERLLIEMFVTYAEESLDILKHTKSGVDEEWKKAAHKLKGSAANLGAKVLSDKCYAAETGFEADKDTKDQLMKDILHAYTQVCAVLKQGATNSDISDSLEAL